MMASSSSYRQPAYALRRRRRNIMMRLVTPILSIIAILLLSSPSSSPSSSFSLSPFSFAFGASSLQYPCLVCEHFLHTYLQNYLLDRSLNANLRPEESITVTTLPTPEEFCTSAAFQRLTHLHIYLDETDRKEIERLEGQSLKSGRQPVSPRFAEFGLDDMTDEEYHADQRQNHPAHIEMRAHIQAEREEQQQHEREAMESNRPEESTSGAHEHEMDPLVMIEVEQDLEMGEYDDEEQLMLSFQHIDDDLTLDEKLLHDDALSDSTLGDALTESDVFIELSLELGAPPSQADVAKKLAALKEEERLAAERRIPLKPLPANVPLTSIEYYAHKSRPVCMVYEDGVCKLFDGSASLTPEIHTLPNPFSRAFIQHKPALLKQVTDRIRARKRRQALHMLSVGDKKRIERVERELLRKSALDATAANPFAPKSKSSKPPLPPRYRKYESCLKIVTRLRTSSQQIQEIVRDGCTYQNRTALRAIPPSPPPPPVTTAKALYQQQPKDPYEEMRRKLMLGEYAWPCPLRAACNGLLQPDGQPYCPTKSMDTRLQPVDLQFLSRGFKGGPLPAEVTKMNSFTPIQQATMASIRNGALPPTTKGFKVQSGGVASSTSKQFKHAQKPIRQQRTQAAKGEVRAKTPLDNIDAEAKRLDNKVSQFRDA